MTQSLTVDIRSAIIAARTSGLFVSLCTIQQPDGVFTVNGSPSGTYVNVTGLIAIPCMDAPKGIDRLSVEEQKLMAEVDAMRMRHVLLNDYYPVLIEAIGQNWRAVIDGTVYDLTGSEPDSQRTMTRLSLRRCEL